MTGSVAETGESVAMYKYNTFFKLYIFLITADTIAVMVVVMAAMVGYVPFTVAFCLMEDTREHCTHVGPYYTDAVMGQFGTQ